MEESNVKNVYRGHNNLDESNVKNVSLPTSVEYAYVIEES